MKAHVWYTDNEHTMAKAEVFAAPFMSAACRLQIAGEGKSGFQGFGVAITPSSCYVLSLMDAGERKQLLEHLYSKDGLGLSVGRLCIGSGDYSPELYTYDDVDGDVELQHFSVERDEAYVIPMIREILSINPDLQLLASPWSPPHWMKTGGSICGGYMREQYLDCYVDYIVKFIQAYGEHGIRIAAITPQNEVNTQQSHKMPSCIWHPEFEAKFICLLKQKLAANSLDTEIWMHDHNFDDVTRVTWLLENYAGLQAACDGVAFHYYSGGIEQTASMKQAYPDLALHFTEGGPRLTDYYDTDWCKWGIMAIKALKLGYSSFLGWNLALDERGGPNIGPFMGVCGGFVTRDSRDGEIRFSGQHKAFEHLASYITPSSTVYPLTTGNTLCANVSQYPTALRDVEGVLIDNGNQKVAVIVNPNATGLQTQIEIGGTLWYAELSAESISTIVAE